MDFHESPFDFAESLQDNRYSQSTPVPSLDDRLYYARVYYGQCEQCEQYALIGGGCVACGYIPDYETRHPFAWAIIGAVVLGAAAGLAVWRVLL